MWFFHRKPKLKLHFIDTDYDPIMYLFKQIFYLDKIADAILDRNRSKEYVINLMNGFIQIHNIASKKIVHAHGKKVLPFGEVEKDKLQKITEYIMKDSTNFIPIDMDNLSPEKTHLLMDIFIFNKEANANKYVSKAFGEVCHKLKSFAEKMEREINEHEDEIQGIYGNAFLRFLKTINKSIKFYHKLSIWLRDDKEAFAKYKLYLAKQVDKTVAHG